MFTPTKRAPTLSSLLRQLNATLNALSIASLMQKKRGAVRAAPSLPQKPLIPAAKRGAN